MEFGNRSGDQDIQGASGGVQSLAVSPDGRYVVSGGFESNILLWDIGKSTAVRKYFIGKGKEQAGAHSVAFSPDGKYIIAACFIDERAFIRIFEQHTGKTVKEFKGHKASISSIAISPDGKYIASGSGWLDEEGKDNTVRVWDIKKGSEIKKFSGHTKGIMSVAFSPDGRYVASASRDKTVRLWEVAGGNEARTYPSANDLVGVAFSPDGRRLLSSGQAAMELRDVASGQIISTFKADVSMGGVAYSPDGRYAAFCFYSAVALWDVSNVTNGAVYHQSAASVKLYGYSQGDLKTFGGNVAGANIAYFSSGGAGVKIAQNKKLFEYSLKTGEKAAGTEIDKVYAVQRNQMRYIRIVEATPQNPKDVIIDTQTDGEILRRPFSSGWPDIRTFSADGKLALVARHNPDKLAVIDTKEFKEICTLSSNPGSAFLSSFQFSPDGRVMAGAFTEVSDPDSVLIRLWDVRTGKQIRTFPGHSHFVSALAFTPDGTRLLSGSMDNTLKIWSVATGKEIKTLAGHSGVVETIVVSANGEWALTGSWDNTVKLWDIAGGKEIRTFKGHTNHVGSVSFSPDGRQVVSASNDGTTRLWNVATGEEVAQFINFTDGAWIVITPEGYFNASPDGAKYLNVRVGDTVYSVDNFYEKFFNPVYVASVLQGKKMEAAGDIRKGVLSPPDVLITSPAPGREFTTDTLMVTVAAKDTGGGIDEIRLYHNGKAIGEDARAVKIVSRGGEAIREYTVSLVDGINTFRAIGFSKDRTESNPYELAVKLAAPSKDVSLYVFSVGINRYKNPALNLNYAEPDARGIADFFKKQGGGLFKKVDIREIYDEQATKENIVSKLSQLQTINPQDAVLIYLAGHGENISEKWYFIPHELAYPEREEEVKAKGLSSDELSGYIKNIKAQKILLLIDACKSGAVLVAFRGFEDRKALSQLSRSTGVHIVAASSKDQFAAEVKELGHGVFTYTLLEGLKGKASGGSQTVTVRKLMGYIEEQLPDITKKYKQEAQYPVVDSKGMDFPLAIVK